MKDLGSLKYFLMLAIPRSTIEIVVCQRSYTLQLLEDFRFLHSKPKSTPMNACIVLQGTSSDFLDDATPY